MGAFETDQNCIEQRKYVNIPLWHNAGYLGQGLNVFCDDAGGSHAACTRDIVQTILPKANVLSGMIMFSQKDGIINSCNISCEQTGELLPFDDFIQKHNIQLINNSRDGGEGEKILPIAIYMKEKIKQYNLIFTGAAGNINFQPTTQLYNGACIVVTSCHLQDGKLFYTTRCTGNNIDFAMFRGYQPGTSFSAPFLLGMAGLIRCRYPQATQEEIYNYFRSNCLDIYAEGKDMESGWGLPIMNAPSADENGKLLLEKYVMTSPFGFRVHPVTGEKILHNGTDYATSGQPPIFSPFAGTVKKVGKDQYGALFVYIDYGAYVGMAYHCSKIIVYVGQKIIKGQVIGYVGSTGRSTGEHLHWSWIVNNEKALDYYGASYVDWEGDWMINIRDIKVLVDGTEKVVKAILYNDENYIRLRDFEDKLGVVDVEYDAVKKMPTIKD